MVFTSEIIGLEVSAAHALCPNGNMAIRRKRNDKPRRSHCLHQGGMDGLMNWNRNLSIVLLFIIDLMINFDK